ncbi:hypothetical protein TWF694_006768 [Orbilia ellipsospora]|uniref:Uncharacterized protein n=1 Tax=Orbilia ellipsospora TaxID=2528407 RepID=A0AAV9XPK8_9PEZI
MLSAAKLNHLKLNHLQAASQTLFPSSPAISAHISAKLTRLANTANIQLSESTWRNICAACGYTLVPGWTATVRVRGTGADSEFSLSSSPWKRKRIKEEKGEIKDVGLIDIGDADVVLPGTNGKVPRRDSDTSRNRIRKRGKRTRGNKHNREKTAGSKIRQERDDGDSIIPQTLKQQVGSRKSDRKPEKSTTVTPVQREPRVVYACKICDRKSIHSVPVKPIGQASEKHAREVPSDKAVVRSEQTAVVSIATATSTFPSSASHIAVVEQESAASVTAPSATNATAKKRAKSRKNTLSEMLAKEAANRSVANSNTGFGLDLMDFMRTS